MVENADTGKAKSEKFITRFARYYTPAVVAVAALLALVPPLIVGGEWLVWLNRSLIFLVISCPCALVVSVPLTFFAGIGGASRKGILVKGSNYLEMMAHIKNSRVRQDRDSDKRQFLGHCHTSPNVVGT